MKDRPEEPISECCGAPPLGDIHERGGKWAGMCSDCRDHATFTDLTEEERVGHEIQAEAEQP